MPLEQKSQFPLRILNSVKDKVRALAKQEGQSINKTAEKLLLKGLRYDSDISAKDKEIATMRKTLEMSKEYFKDGIKPYNSQYVAERINDALRARGE